MATPPQIRKLLYYLDKCPIVRECQLSYRLITVRFTNGITERWLRRDAGYLHDNCWIYELPDEFGDVRDTLQIKHEFELNPLDEDFQDKKKYFMVSAKDYRQAKLVPRQLMVHELILKIMDDGYIPLKFHDDELMQDFLKFKSDDLTRFIRGGNLRLYASYGQLHRMHGMKILEHFIPINSLAIWSRPFRVYQAITRAIRARRDLRKSIISRYVNTDPRTREEVIKGPPSFYRLLFQSFGITNKVIGDPDPGFGSKALASIMCDCEYHYGFGQLSYGVKEMSEFLDVEFFPMADRSYDVIIIDTDWTDDIDKLMLEVELYRPMADNMLVYVPTEHMEEFSSKYEILEKRRIDIHPLYDKSIMNFVCLI